VSDERQQDTRAVAQELAAEVHATTPAPEGGGDPVASRAMGLGGGLGTVVSGAVLERLKGIGQEELTSLFEYVLGRARARLGG
jgi:hypothetical protein